MKSTKTLFSALLIISLFCSFAVKPKTSNSYFCGPWVTFCNNGSVDVEYAQIDDPPASHEIYNLTSMNCDYTGPAIWGFGGTGGFEVRIKLASGQNGSIRVFEGNTEIHCEPTYSSTTIYRIDFPINGCYVYTIVVSTGSC